MLNDIQGQEETNDTPDYSKCVEDIMRDISGRRGFDLYTCDDDIIEDIRNDLDSILRTHFDIKEKK